MTDPAEPRRCALDPDRAVLRLSGPDRTKFLQGLVTNNIARAGDDGLIYAALLSPQGKYLTEMLVWAEPGALLLDLPATAADETLRRLALYRLRADVALDRTGLAVMRGLGPAPAGARPDPRDPGLGWRRIAAPGDLPASEGPEVDWAALHVARKVPQHGLDLLPGESFVLEFDFPRLDGVDFRKGCYVGQEVTARMRHKTELRRGLFAVALDGPAEPGTPILTADGREAGRLGTVAGRQALALLRLDRAAGSLTAGTAGVRVLEPLPAG